MAARTCMSRFLIGGRRYQLLKLTCLNRGSIFGGLCTVPNGKEEPTTTATGQEDEKTDDKILKLEEQLTKLQTDITTVEKKHAEVQDKYKRSLAETENLRTRMQKQIDDVKLFGIQSFCKDLLEVADIMGKATESIPEDELKNNSQLKNLFDGFVMTETQLLKVFKKNGLDQMNPVGEKFDPHQHEALFQIPDPDKAPGSVAVVTKIGYTLHGRTVRPALVGVVATPS